MRFSSSIVITALLTLSAARVQIAPDVTPPEIDPGKSLKSTSGEPESLGKTDPSKAFGNGKRTLTSRADRAAESPGGGGHPGHSGKLMHMIRSVSSRSGMGKLPSKTTGDKKTKTQSADNDNSGDSPHIGKLRRLVESEKGPSKTTEDKKTNTRSADNGANSPSKPIHDKLMRLFRA
ncbi:uncharacterized protein RAG0_03571 [Rhynchosporium agropyri]|uniref:Uncharacterized protein n=1 Tax=Rhynchosporium agropyri TaxID=914238 RepID=A0A1E1K591_9HELO|nr:uncharacterized protein RAG0_03571 [Rhynchosporium agropyri]